MPYDKPKVAEGAFWPKSGGAFHTGDLIFKDDFFYEGVNLKGLKIPLKLNENKFRKEDRHPTFRIELNDWQPSGKATKPEHALALAASIRKKIEPTPTKMNDEKQMPSFFDDDQDIPF